MSMGVVAEEPWMEHGKCRGLDPALFFPERGESTWEAKTVCRSCEVREECLDYAMRTAQKWGVWGGLSERERRRLRREMFNRPMPRSTDTHCAQGHPWTEETMFFDADGRRRCRICGREQSRRSREQRAS